MKTDIETTKKPDYVMPAFLGELDLPDFPEEKGRRAYELLRVVATFEPYGDDHDIEKVEASQRYHVQVPEPEIDFPHDNGEFWGRNLAEIAWAIANDENVVWSEMPPLKLFNKICATFLQKAAQIAVQKGAEEAAQKAAQEAAQKDAHRWAAELVEKAAGSSKKGAAQ
jgi:hypothetical protein